MKRCTCPTCGSSLEEPLMKPVKLKVIRGMLGHLSGRGRPLSQPEFGALIGRSDRMVRLYERGIRPIPKKVADRAQRLLHRARGRQTENAE